MNLCPWKAMRQADIDRLRAWMVRPQCHLIAGRAADDTHARNTGAFSTTCGGTGYYRRTGIFELFVVTDKIRDLIKENPNINAIKQEAVKSGMHYLYEDGLRVVIEGRTSIQELLRVSK